jgi:hypothetical protein
LGGGGRTSTAFLYFVPERQGVFRGIFLLTARWCGAGFTKRIQAVFTEALGDLALGEVHQGVHIARGGVGAGRGFGSRELVGDLFLEGAAFLEFAEFVEGAAKNEVGLGSGAVDGFLLLFGALVDHGIEV